MSKFVRRLLVASIVVFVIAVLIVCGTYLAYTTSAGSSVSPKASETSSPSSPTAPSADTSPSENADASASTVAETNVTSTQAPSGQITALNTAIKKRAYTPISSLNLDAYLTSIAKTSNAIWRDYFVSIGLQDPVVSYDITSGSDRYVSTCVRDGKEIVVTASYTHTFYCSSDGSKTGQIALPTAAFTSPSPWVAGTSRGTGDLSVAVTVTRTTSHIVIESLRGQLSLGSPSATNRQYTASCLSGAQVYGLYPMGVMSENQIRNALELSFAVPSEVDGVVTSPPATDEQLYTAWMVGYNTGSPGECVRAFWK